MDCVLNRLQVCMESLSTFALQAIIMFGAVKYMYMLDVSLSWGYTGYFELVETGASGLQGYVSLSIKF